MAKIKESRQSALSKKIYKKHLILFRKLNDTFIFVNQAIPILEKEKKCYHSSQDYEKDLKYFVPSHKKTKYAYRTDKELQNIYNRFLKDDLYKAILSSCISDFEDFLFTSLKEILKQYPQKATTSVSGVSINKDIKLEQILLFNDINSLLDNQISNIITHISYLSPLKYFEYFAAISGVKISDVLIHDYIELKASRDLIIHNNSIINNVYLIKAGSLSRGKINERISIDQDYFDNSIALLKNLSGIIRREIDLIYK